MKQSIGIRFITKEDTDHILQWRNAPSVIEHFVYRKPLTREEHLNWLETKVTTGEVAQFIIEEVENKIPIGSVYLRDIDNIHQKAEFGIFIGEDAARGKGYGTQATLLILQYAFETLGLNKVTLRVFAENQRAIHCYKKVGFIEDGRFRDDVCINGKFHDMVFMSILRKEWESRK